MRLFFSFLSLAFICSCASTETYDRTFEQAVEALDMRFDRNQWSPNSTEYAIKTEPVKGTERIYEYFHTQYPNTQVKYTITVKRLDSETTSVAVDIDDFETALTPCFYEKSYQQNFHDSLVQYFKTKKWPSLSYEPANYLCREDMRKAPEALTVPASDFPAFAPAKIPVTSPVDLPFEDTPAETIDF